MFRWSFQDKYFAKQGLDGIYMYDIEVKIREKKSNLMMNNVFFYRTFN